MKIIDFEKKGNVVRFYLGYDDCDDYCGDDWNDKPYGRDGQVYNEYVCGHIDVAFSFDSLVIEPCEQMYANCNYSKYDFKRKLAPCILVVPKELTDDSWYTDYDYWSADGSGMVVKYYFDDCVYDCFDWNKDNNKSYTILSYEIYNN